MPEKAPLFPDKARALQQAVEAFFKQLPGSRALHPHELVRFGQTAFLCGWRTSVSVGDQAILVDILLDHEIPYSLPRHALAKDEKVFEWPHVEGKGKLCVLNEESTIDHSRYIDVIQYLLQDVKSLFQESAEGKNREDFLTEFESYWALAALKDMDVLSHVNLEGPARAIKYLKRGSLYYTFDDVQLGLKWLTDIYGKENKIKASDFKDGVFIELDRAIAPDEYPNTNQDLYSLIKRIAPAHLKLLESAVPAQVGGNCLVLLALKVGDGRAMAAVNLNEPYTYQGKDHKAKAIRGRGFRPGSLDKDPMRTQLFFATNGVAHRLTVTRTDPQYLYLRGGNGQYKMLENKKVTILGLGSLGSSVAELLAQSGIRTHSFMDQDGLRWGNLPRHVLDASYVGKNKAESMKAMLSKKLPGCLSIEAHPCRWQDAYHANPAIFDDSDLIIATMGHWDSDAALDELRRENPNLPPVVYAWLEPYAVAGHAILMSGSCNLTDVMSPYGDFEYRVSNWPESALKNLPACGAVYQPYGAAEIPPVHHLICKLAIDALTGDATLPRHDAWIGDIEQLVAMGGSLNSDVSSYYGNYKKSGLIVRHTISARAEAHNRSATASG